MIASKTSRNDEFTRVGVPAWGGHQDGAAIIMPPADQALARRVEGAWSWLGVENARAQARLRPGSGATSLSIAGGSAVFLGVGSPLSQAQGLGLHGPVAEVEIERMEAFFGERGAPIALEVASLAEPSFLRSLSR